MLRRDATRRQLRQDAGAGRPRSHAVAGGAASPSKCRAVFLLASCDDAEHAVGQRLLQRDRLRHLGLARYAVPFPCSMTAHISAVLAAHVYWFAPKR